MKPPPFAPTAVAFAKAASTSISSSSATVAGTTSHAATSSAACSSSDRLRAFRRIVRSRTSARRFEPNVSVPDRVWKDVLRMTMTSPSGFNLQPTHVILLVCPHIKSALSEHAMLGFGNQYRTKDASAVAVFCADLEPSKRIDRIFQMERESGVREDGYLAVVRVAASFLTGEGSTASITGNTYGGGGGNSSTHLSTFLKQTFTHALSPVQPMPTMENVEAWSYKNAGIAAQTYTMAATAHGLGTCMMEGYDARRVREILRVPDRFGIPLMVATGYEFGAEKVIHPDDLEEEDLLGGGSDEPEKARRTPRLEMNELFFGDTFGAPLDFLLDDTEPSETENVA